MAELPLHNPPRTPSCAPVPGSVRRFAQYPSKFVPARYVRWLPILLAIPLVLWLLGPYTWRFARPVVPPFDNGVVQSQPKPSKSFSPPPSVWTGHADRVKDAFVHAYGGYMKHAFPSDELLPIGGLKTDKWAVLSSSLFGA